MWGGLDVLLYVGHKNYGNGSVSTEDGTPFYC